MDYGTQVSTLTRVVTRLVDATSLSSRNGTTPRLAYDNTLTQLGETLTPVLRSLARAGELSKDGAQGRFVQFCERGDMSAAQFFTAFPNDGAALYREIVEALQAQVNSIPTPQRENKLSESVKPRSTSVDLHEAVDLRAAKVDSAKRMLSNVVLIRAGKGKNGNFYPESTLQAAVGVFEGVRAYDGHAAGARKVAEITGFYKDVRYDAGALKADRYFTDTAAGRDVWAVAESIAKGEAPVMLAGLSINASGTGKKRQMDGGEVFWVDAIKEGYSVDDVDNPAQFGSYKESKNARESRYVIQEHQQNERWQESKRRSAESNARIARFYESLRG